MNRDSNSIRFPRRLPQPDPFHESDPIIPSFSPSGGEGARRAVEGDSDRFMVPMLAKKRMRALHKRQLDWTR